ncbi:MAG: gfo/Idh/MocA family oxidoreductase, partial [Verrucomicrobia bacterium]|nr:gfo/Idh/MocA family oxidoreductase [Verrucomicrobiota bacterium]
TQLIYHDYGKKSLIFEVRGLPTSSTDGKMDNLKGASIGVIIECEGGYMVNPSYTSATAYDNDGNEIKKFNGGGNHHANWLDAVRSRKVSDLNSDIIEGHISSALCHTGNISYRLGHLASPKQVAEVLNSLPNMAEAGQRVWEHLQANKIDLNLEKTYLGPVLEMYEGTELFVGNDKANAMMTRDYRYPFVVPNYI